MERNDDADSGAVLYIIPSLVLWQSDFILNDIIGLNHLHFDKTHSAWITQCLPLNLVALLKQILGFREIMGLFRGGALTYKPPIGLYT